MATLTGRPLRYVLTMVLSDGRERTVGELVQALDADSIAVPGRPSKVISDALRWEIGRGRVRRTGPGSYCIGVVPESTMRYIRKLAADWIEQAAATGQTVGLRYEPGKGPTSGTFTTRIDPPLRRFPATSRPTMETMRPPDSAAS